MRKPAPAPPAEKFNSPKALRVLRWSVMALVLDLTFEGLARKLNIRGSNIAIFLLKDVIVALIGVQVLRLRRPPTIDFLWAAYVVEAILFLPPILTTAAHDPILAIFGAKEYLLYPMVAFGLYIAYETASLEEIMQFFRRAALLVIPTTAMALLQLQLPQDHWLNMSVQGESLEGFAAGGYLRVSSTFPFVAQYCAFLNAEVFITMMALNSLRGARFFMRMVYLSIVPLLVIGSYVTGSRGAVLVNCAIVAIAAGLSLLRFQSRSALRVVAIIFGLVLTLFVAHYAMPNAFEAYSTRENGKLLGASEEIQQRIYAQFFNWMGDAFTTPFFGNGLGIMSNGSDVISHYAAMTRGFNMWTETDFSSTLFEGGLYLIIVWYGFRYFVIYQAVRHYLGMRDERLAVPGGFCLGYLVIIGLMETLGIQPPIAIWWWLSVGTAFLVWRKSLDPKPEEPPPPGPAAEQPAARKFRGQSSYAAKLHARDNTP